MPTLQKVWSFYLYVYYFTILATILDWYIGVCMGNQGERILVYLHYELGRFQSKSYWYYDDFNWVWSSCVIHEREWYQKKHVVQYPYPIGMKKTVKSSL